MAHIDFLDETIRRLDAKIKERLRLFEDAINRLDAIPGIGRRTAEVMVAEIGTNMGHFPMLSKSLTYPLAGAETRKGVNNPLISPLKAVFLKNPRITGPPANTGPPAT